MKTESWIQLKKKNKKWTMLTAYDAPTAELVHSCGVDMLLVGDSVGMVLLGYKSTLPVTMNEMIHHAKAVRRGAPKAFVIGDMPYESVCEGPAKALLAAQRFVKEAGCDAVKLEWRKDAPETVRRVVRAGIPVMGHLGLTPQESSKKGAPFKVQATLAEDALELVGRARQLESLGAFGVLLECVPRNVAQAVTARLKIPTIGIGAGPDCDGQVVVYYDLIGAFRKFRPKFVKPYDDVYSRMVKTVTRYARDVRSGRFPSDTHSFHMRPEEEALFRKRIR